MATCGHSKRKGGLAGPPATPAWVLIGSAGFFGSFFGSVSVEGEWIIEGYGVDPDIVVENDPKSVLAGKDPQLERAVAEVMKKMETEPKKLPKKPADPIQTQAGVAGGPARPPFL